MSDGSVVIDAVLDSAKFKIGINSLGSIAKSAGIAMAAALGAASAAVVKLGRDAIVAYAEYEQLVGGVETLFKDSSDQVMQYAENAFKTAGMSANQYMETVTGFSASLLQSLGGDTQKAADIGNMAVTDMADNANKMGTAIGSIQDAYQGFAKQNYTMLDNLKLGYGGTKTEMERLLADAEKISGIKYDISNLSDVYSAIHVIQTELGITGTTAEEAEKTLSGSANMAKAAWENFLSGLPDSGQNMGKLVDNLVDSISAFSDNLVTRIVELAPRLGEGFGKLAEELAPKIPAVLDTLLPVLIDTATTLVESAIEVLPDILTVAIENLDDIANASVKIIIALIDGLAEAMPQLILAAVEITLAIVDAFIDNIDLLVDAGIELLLAIIDGLIQALPQLVAKAPEIIIKLAAALIRNMPKILDAGRQIPGKLKEGIGNALTALGQVGKELIQGLINGIKSKFTALKEKAAEAAQVVKDKIAGLFKINSPSKWAMSIGAYVMEGLAVGLKNGVSKAVKSASDAVGAVKAIYTNELEKLNSEIAEIEKRESERQAEEELERHKEEIAKLYDEMGKATKSEQEKLQKEIAELEKEWQDKQAKETLEAQKENIEAVKDAYEDAVDEIADKQKSMSVKLSEYNSDLFYENDDGKIYLTDFEKNARHLKEYADLLEQIKNKGVSENFLSEFSNLGIDDAIKFAKKLLENDSVFDEYISEWEEQQKISREIAANFYRDEVNAIETEFTSKLAETLGKASEDALVAGEETAESFAEGFVSKMKAVAGALREAVSLEISSDSSTAYIMSKNSQNTEIRSIYQTTTTEKTPIIKIDGNGSIGGLARMLLPYLRVEENRAGTSVIKGVQSV